MSNLPSDNPQPSSSSAYGLNEGRKLGMKVEKGEDWSSLSKLVNLSLGVNNLVGSIPAWIGNFSSLYILDLFRNSLQGSIPSELGFLSSLGKFQLYGNYLSGTIPSLIYNISSIYYFSVTLNQLHGSIPPDVGLTLPNLQIFAGAVNSFTGTIPASLSNASQLQVLDFSQNNLTGTVPQNLASLQGLVRLNFEVNKLGKGNDGDLNFLNNFANCTSLEVLSFAQNQLGGILPSVIANLSMQLRSLTMGSNMIRGSIPIGIGNLVNLNLLGLEVFKIGLSCSTTSPDERMPTNVVVNEMNAIRDAYLKFKMENKRRMN
ncbi:putative receptor-like protein kinase [Quercus suber]|uniref:Receptor-like protein kinase n=1 Tax=Quercus suber TaxID=58331 RepID=A0AAW0KT37_QUESU